MNEKIWLSSLHLGIKKEKYVNEAFNINRITTLGPNQNSFEKDKKNYALNYGKHKYVAHTTYLLSKACKWVTGTNLKLDGGLTLR